MSDYLGMEDQMAADYANQKKDSAAQARRDWAIVNAWLLMKHRHVHPLIRASIRRWIDYGKQATT